MFIYLNISQHGTLLSLCGERSTRPLHPGGGRFLDQTALLAAKRIHRQCKAKGKRFAGREASFKIIQNHSSFAGDASGNPGDGGNPEGVSFFITSRKSQNQHKSAVFTWTQQLGHTNLALTLAYFDIHCTSSIFVILYPTHGPPTQRPT